MVSIHLDADLVAVMQVHVQDTDEPLDRRARELIVIELYRRDVISGGKAAELLGMSRLDFIRFSGQFGIPYGNMTAEDWEADLRAVDEIVSPSSPTAATLASRRTANVHPWYRRRTSRVPCP